MTSRLFAPKPQQPPTEEGLPVAIAGESSSTVNTTCSCYLLVKPMVYKDPVWAGLGTRRILGRLDTYPVPRLTPFEALPFALFLGSKEAGDIGLTVMLAKTLALPAHVAPFVTYYTPTTKDKTLGLANEVATILKHTDVERGGNGGSVGGKLPQVTLEEGKGWEAEHLPRTEETITAAWTISLILGSVRYWNTTTSAEYCGRWFDSVGGATTSGSLVGGYGSTLSARGNGYSTGGGGRRLDGKEETTFGCVPVDDYDEEDELVSHHVKRNKMVESKSVALNKIPNDQVCSTYLGAALVSGSLDLFTLCLRMFRLSESFDPLPQCLGKAAGVRNGRFLSELVRCFPPRESDLVAGGHPHSPLKVACETGLEEQVLNLLYTYTKNPRRIVNANIFRIPNFSNNETLINVAIYYNQRLLAHRLISEISPEILAGIQEAQNLPLGAELKDELSVRENRLPLRKHQYRGRQYSDRDDQYEGGESGDDSDSSGDYDERGAYSHGSGGTGTHKRYSSHPIDTAIESAQGPDSETVLMLTTKTTELYAPPVPEAELAASVDPEGTKLLFLKRYQRLGLGVRVDYVDDNGFTFLHKAALKKSLPMIKVLLQVAHRQHEDDPDNRLSPEQLMLVTTYGELLSPLHSVAEVGDAAMVRFFLGDNPYNVRLDPDSTTRNLWTPLHFAGSSNAVEATQLLLENGARVSMPDIEGDTPLKVTQTMFEVYPILKKAMESEEG